MTYTAEESTLLQKKLSAISKAKSGANRIKEELFNIDDEEKTSYEPAKYEMQTNPDFDSTKPISEENPTRIRVKIADEVPATFGKKEEYGEMITDEARNKRFDFAKQEADKLIAELQAAFSAS